jgi:Kdo2-lipid IVA lauroyltransferase/acyltransferase
MSEDDPDPPPPKREALWQKIAVGLLSGLIWLVGKLPTWIAYPIGVLMAVPWFLWWSIHDRAGKRSSGYWRNCRIAFRQGSPLGRTRPKGHLWRWSKHIAWLAIDFCRMERITKQNVQQVCDLDEYPRIADAISDGKGLIFATGHLGVWDVSGWVAGLQGLPIWSVFRPSPLPALNRLIERLRVGSGQHVIARKNVLRALLKLLGERRAVAILADGGGKHSAVEAPFLGTAARSVASPALLHLATGAPIVVLAVFRTGWMRYRLRVLDVIRDAGTGDREADMLAITARINRGLSHGIAEFPHQWFWQSRRFRHRPAGEIPGPDGLPPLAAPAPAPPAAPPA